MRSKKNQRHFLNQLKQVFSKQRRGLSKHLIIWNLLLVLNLTGIVNLALAQQNTNELPSIWAGTTIRANLPANFALTTLVSIRRKDLGRSWQQFLVRPYVSYRINRWLASGVGYTFSETYNQQLEASQAHGILEQIAIKHQLSKFRFSHRLRFEQYFQNTAFNPRVRYRFLLRFYSLERLNFKFFIQAYNEFFLPMEATPIPDMQNRAYLGLGVKIPKKALFTLGYRCRWYDYNQCNHIIDIGLLVLLDFSQKRKQ